MDWYFHSQFSIDSGWHLLTKLRNTLVMRSFCAPFVSPPISLVWKVSRSTWRCCNCLWVCHEASMMVSSCINDWPLSWAATSIPSHPIIPCVCQASASPQATTEPEEVIKAKAVRVEDTSCPDWRCWRIHLVNVLQSCLSCCFFYTIFLWGERGRRRFIASYCLFKCGKVKKGGRIIVQKVPSWRIQWLDTLLAWRKQA